MLAKIYLFISNATSESMFSYFLFYDKMGVILMTNALKVLFSWGFFPLFLLLLLLCVRLLHILF